MRRALPTRAAAIPLLAWLLLYVPLALTDHYALRTNGYDLSVFDYALWSTLEGRPGQVPFMGHSLFCHHFMPTLLILAPLYAAFPSPVFLILLQLGAAAGAAVLLGRLSAARLPGALSAALVTAFLFSRASHGAVTGFFYVESLLPLLLFALLLAWESRSRHYWVLLPLALGCKEDVGLYLGAFGLWLAWQAPERRMQGIVTSAVAASWLALAVAVAVPQARARDGLPLANPFLESRYASAAEEPLDEAIAGRIASWRAVKKVFNVTSSTALLCWTAPGLLAVAAPGVLLNLAARSGTQQSALLGHYLWPILPWVFLAAVFGCARICRRRPTLARPMALVLFTVVVADSPLWLTLLQRPWQGLPAARAVREQLRQVPPDASLLAQANLIPHLPHRTGLVAVGRERAGPEPSYVLLTEVGDLWPLGREGTRSRIAGYYAARAYEVVAEGPLFVFRRRLSPSLDFHGQESP